MIGPIKLLLISSISTVLADSSSRFGHQLAHRGPHAIYRGDVDPSIGGKVPESAHMREHTFNVIDTHGLDFDQSHTLGHELRDEYLPQRLGHASAAEKALGHFDVHSGYSGHHTRPSGQPAYAPYPGVQSAAYDIPPLPSPYKPHSTAYKPVPLAYKPKPVAYTPAPYVKPAYEAHPLLYKKPAYKPVLPYDGQVKPLTVVLGHEDGHFDCQTKRLEYDTYFADTYSGCAKYFLCHKDGRQQSYSCGYGTLFNELTGTCDHQHAVQCHSTSGYAVHYERPYLPADGLYGPAKVSEPVIYDSRYPTAHSVHSTGPASYPVAAYSHA